MKQQTPEEFADQLKRDVESVFKSSEGERVMEFLEQICHYNLPTLSSKGGDGVARLTNTLINDGKREVILTLKTIMKWPVDKIAEEITNQVE
jgi:hypothetical protein